METSYRNLFGHVELLHGKLEPRQEAVNIKRNFNENLETI